MIGIPASSFARDLAPEYEPNTNVAPLGTASASSAANGDQTAPKAIDEVISGFPYDYTKEWAANTGDKVGAWLQVTWAEPVTIDRAILYDRPNSNDNILTGTLTFSSGDPVAFGALPNTWALESPNGLEVTFSERTVTWVRMTVDSMSGSAERAGLAEMEVYTP